MRYTLCLKNAPPYFDNNCISSEPIFTIFFTAEKSVKFLQKKQFKHYSLHLKCVAALPRETSIFKFVAVFCILYCVPVQGGYQTRGVKFHHNLAESLSRVRFHGLFCESVAYLLGSCRTRTLTESINIFFNAALRGLPLAICESVDSTGVSF